MDSLADARAKIASFRAVSCCWTPISPCSGWGSRSSSAQPSNPRPRTRNASCEVVTRSRHRSCSSNRSPRPARLHGCAPSPIGSPSGVRTSNRRSRSWTFAGAKPSNAKAAFDASTTLLPLIARDGQGPIGRRAKTRATAYPPGATATRHSAVCRGSGPPGCEGALRSPVPIGRGHAGVSLVVVRRLPVRSAKRPTACSGYIAARPVVRSATSPGLCGRVGNCRGSWRGLTWQRRRNGARPHDAAGSALERADWPGTVRRRAPVRPRERGPGGHRRCRRCGARREDGPGGPARARSGAHGAAAPRPRHRRGARDGGGRRDPRARPASRGPGACPAIP